MGYATELRHSVWPQRAGRAHAVAAAAPRAAAPAARSPLALLQQSIGNRAVGRLVQAKLRVGSPSDRFEQEADRVAGNLMRMPVPHLSAAPQAAASEAPAIVHELVRAPGQPLDAPTRARFEPRFGRDFSDVRVHTGPAADRAARAVNAQAYAVGRDMVFAAGQFAPATHDGQRLIAHELAHVVQQSDSHRDGSAGRSADRGSDAPPTPLIQRKLLLRDKPKPRHVRALFDLLESPSGLTLEYDPASEEVSISGSRLTPPAPALRLRLEEIIDDQRLHAELRLGGPRQGISFGKFPETGPLIQEIDIENLTRLEAGAPGSGAAILFHEIVENHHAHAFGRDFEPAHAAALEAESEVASKLVRSGRRVARAIVDKGRGVIRWVFDYEQYFLVFDRDLNTNVVTNSRHSARVNVGTFTIAGFTRGSEAVPQAAQPVIAAVANAMRMSPAATVRIEGGGPDAQLALRRAARIQSAILAYGKDRRLHGFDFRSGFNFNLVATGRSNEELVIVVDQPDTEVEGYRGSLVKAWLTSKPPRPAQRRPGAPARRPR